MVRFIFPVALALGASLVAGNAAQAGDGNQFKVGTTGGRTQTSTMTLGGKGTAASAAAAADTEQAWYHGYYRGYRRGFYNGYYGGLGGYYAGYYPYAYPYANPYYYGAAYYPPLLGVGVRVGPVGVGVYGINGSGSDASAPAVSLNLAGTTNQVTQKPVPSSNEQPGAYRYDGGPANPVPLPKQDVNAPNGQATPTLPPNTGLPVSLPKTVTPAKPAKPYTYKGFGEK
jgi:hypothetical protein